jgi:NAD+ synthase (glutamine-hydrolysing)
MKIAIAQINPIIADIDGNTVKIIACISRAKQMHVDLVVFPEMAIIGYPPMDLLENKKLIEDNIVALETIASYCDSIAAIVGHVDYSRNRPPLLINSAAFLHNGQIACTQAKTLLPTYDVFDELRYFTPATEIKPISFMNHTLGITICEDIWNDQDFDNTLYKENRRYEIDPVESLISQGADFIINISASPYCLGKNTVKWAMIQAIAQKYSIPVLYVNQVGGNDSLIFDGNSICVNARGDLIAKAKSFDEDLLLFKLETANSLAPPTENNPEDIRRALVLGLRDYVRKCGFTDAIVGLSGGIDSALTAALAVEALGNNHVMGITMPSMYSSRGSIDDSVQLAKNLGIPIHTIPIAELYYQYRESLSEIFRGFPEDVTEENIQARIRGNLLMAISNKFGSLLLTTGNKSELAMGYCTLYGDMSGGLAVISDLPKTLVYELARYINKEREIIPRATIEKAPSAELRPNQKDQDSLPPYDVLDRILECYIEKRMSMKEIIACGFDRDTVADVLAKVNRNEYKRIQAAPGLKVTSKAFGIGRRVPIAQKFRP